MNRIVRLFALTIFLLFASISQAELIDINTADAQTLDKNISGVGLKRAQAIVDFRKENGPFKSVDDLALVKGIGPTVVEKNRAKLTVGGQQ